MYINILDFVQNANELIFKNNGFCEIDTTDLDFSLVDKPKYDLLVSKVDQELLLNIDVEYQYVKPCDRCLAEVRNFNNIKYSAKLLNTISKKEDDKNQYDNEVVFMEQYKIDICDLVKELVILSIPMKNLCSDDCQGICPKCGQNLNKGKCDCDTENIDFRFSVLKDFKIDEEV